MAEQLYTNGALEYALPKYLLYFGVDFAGQARAPTGQAINEHCTLHTRAQCCRQIAKELVACVSQIFKPSSITAHPWVATLRLVEWLSRLQRQKVCACVNHTQPT